MSGPLAKQDRLHQPASGVRYAVSALDQMNYIVRQVGDQQLHSILIFDGQLDTSALHRAVRMTLDIEPVLGCRYVEKPRRAYWEQRTDMDDTGYFQIAETHETPTDLWRFICTTADPRIDPPIQVRLFRDQTDTLCVKTSHVVADAMSCKQYLYWLSTLYRHIRQDASYSPKRILRSGRSEGQLFRRFGPLTLKRAYHHRFSPTPTWGFPRQSTDFSGLGYIIMRLPPDRFNLLKEYGHQRHATLNDIVLAAFYRALFEIVDPPYDAPLPVSVPVDLRRYLPEKTSLPICNFSGSIFPSIKRIAGEGFDETLARLCDNVNVLKTDHPGLSSAIYQTWSFMRGYESAKKSIQSMQALGMQYGTFYPMLTNFGVMDHQRLSFDDLSPTDAFMVSPLFYPPGFMVGVNTYRDKLTVIAGFCHTATDEKIVHQFMKCIDQELPGEGLLPPGITHSKA